MRNPRTCLGCDGTGGLVTCARPAIRTWRRAGLFACGSCAGQPDGSYFVVVPFVDIEEGACHVCGAAFAPCPACLGSGTVTDRLGFTREGLYIPDAVIDAEALSNMNLELRGGRGWSNTSIKRTEDTGHSVRWFLHSDPALAYVRAREGASRAFRAVPALK
jgi:hypothetical protein